MNQLKAFFENKEAQKEWAEFILDELNKEALKRVYSGDDTKALKEAKEIISQSFKRLNELFTSKKPKARVERAV